MCVKANPAIPTNLSVRILFISTYLTAVVLQSAYSGSLMSYLAVLDYNLPFESVVQIVNIPSYQLGFVDHSDIEEEWNVRLNISI